MITMDDLLEFLIKREVYVEMWWNVLTFLPVSELYNDLVGHKINHASQNTLW